MLLGKPESEPLQSYLQVFTWFTEGRDWVRVEVRHVTDSGLVIQTVVEDSEMEPQTALSQATRLASRYHIPFVYFQDALPSSAAVDAAATDSWQLRIR